jgi:hypothetical protein
MFSQIREPEREDGLGCIVVARTIGRTIGEGAVGTTVLINKATPKMLSGPWCRWE